MDMIFLECDEEMVSIFLNMPKEKKKKVETKSLNEKDLPTNVFPQFPGQIPFVSISDQSQMMLQKDTSHFINTNADFMKPTIELTKSMIAFAAQNIEKVILDYSSQEFATDDL